MKTILILGNLGVRINDQLIFCNNLNSENNYRIIFLIERYEEKIVKNIKNNKYNFIAFYDNKNHEINNNKILKNLKNKKKTIFMNFIKNIIIHLSIYQIYKYFKLLKKIKKDYIISQKIFNDIKPDLLIAENDRAPGFEQAILKAAKDSGIKILIPYYAISGGEIFLRKNDIRYKLKIYSSIFTQIVYRKNKHQAYFYNNEIIYFYNSFTLHALSKFGSLSTYPWIIGNGLSDIICVDNQYNYNRYISTGVLKNKIKIVGDLSYDKLYYNFKERSELKKKTIHKYKLVNKKKIIIISLPQLFEHNMLDWENHWNEIIFLMKEIEQTNQNIIISLHPKMEMKNYKILESRFNCKIIEERLYDLLPIADLFIATFSSTIIWSVLCGINSMIIDFYGFDYNIYDFLQTVIIIKDRKKFKPLVIECLYKKIDYTIDWKLLSRDEVFDGNALNRYRKLINEYVK